MGKKKHADASTADEALDKAARKAARAAAGAAPKQGKKSKTRAAGESPTPTTEKPGKKSKSGKANKPGKPGKPDKAERAEKAGTSEEAEEAGTSEEAEEPGKPQQAPQPDGSADAAPTTDLGRFDVEVVVVALAVRDRSLVVAASPTLPTTALRPGEPLVAAAARALGEAGPRASETTLLPLSTDVDGVDCLQVGWVALCGPDATADWLVVEAVPAAARPLVDAAVERIGTLLETTTVATSLVPSTFTVGELRAAYGAVWGVDPDGRNFHRKVTGVVDFLVETGELTTRGGGRPARVYRAGSARRLNPALTRP